MKLTDSVGTLPYVGEAYQEKLAKLGISTIEDLIHHIPRRFLDYSQVKKIRELQIGEDVTVEGEITSIQNIRTRGGKQMQIAFLSDGEDKLEVVWINQSFILRMLKPGVRVQLHGKLGFWGKKRVFSFPKFEIIQEKAEGRLMAIYPETEGISSAWLQKRALDALSRIEELDDFLPETDLDKYMLISNHEALTKIHNPSQTVEWARAHRRLSFNELLLLQLQNAYERIKWRRENKGMILYVNESHSRQFIDNLPFTPTESQVKAMKEIEQDFSRAYPMNRLLEGDVGSGKTLVAAYASFLSIQNGAQAVVMAPTQVLAEQHFRSLSHLLEKYGVHVGLFTGNKKSESDSRYDLIVGTHALLFDSSIFSRTALLVIDEQHRFGVKQRAELIRRTKSESHTPHVLSMTATPIPRTMTLTLYGDLDLSSLDTMPTGRKKIKTWVVPKKKRGKAYSWIESEVKEKKVQVFVVYPLIEESESETFKEVKAATVEYEKIKENLPSMRVGLLHGRMKSKEKENILMQFRDHKFDILVTTPVIEVGIDIPNATIMMIEGADRFGLAALHQLRGRVGRSDKQSYCLLFTENTSRSAINRLKMLEKHTNGRELAEIDLETRGPGEIFGVRQSGLPELKIATWTDIRLIQDAKQHAEYVVENQEKYNALLRLYKRKIIIEN